MSSAKPKNRLCEMQENLDKRTIGYKRRMEAMNPKPDTVVQILERTLKSGFSADYVLMDSWFTHASLLQKLLDKGLITLSITELDQ